MADETEERVDGPTPNGGTYAVAYFRDKDGSPCPKAGSASMEIVEFDDADQEVRRTYMHTSDTPTDIFADDDARPAE